MKGESKCFVLCWTYFVLAEDCSGFIHVEMVDVEMLGYVLASRELEPLWTTGMLAYEICQVILLIINNPTLFKFSINFSFLLLKFNIK